MIGKTRHLETRRSARHAPAPRAEFGQGCGILRHSPPPGSYHHRRFAPPAGLAGWVEHFWLEDWQFESGVPQTREVLPHPNVHLVFAPGRSRIYGVQLGRFVRQLKDQDCIFGIKLHPGAFHPFLRRPVSAIANTSIPVAEVFRDAADAEKEILACSQDAGRVRAATDFLLAHLPSRDPRVDDARRAVGRIARDRGVTRVEHLVARCGIGERTLQRLFDRYVGASPRWVIKRYRIYEALAGAAAGTRAEWADLAQSLGYFDQAHFINDFRKLVGCSPAEYAEPLA
ncbi:helix-turn-helix domain-containing protein [Rudaea sp.]|uniref:helix-turn-helix domain-containing protein n=1 Tax=Rudaea sp. TaxID=2136325 RepID=UPI00321FCA71